MIRSILINGINIPVDKILSFSNLRDNAAGGIWFEVKLVNGDSEVITEREVTEEVVREKYDILQREFFVLDGCKDVLYAEALEQVRKIAEAATTKTAPTMSLMLESIVDTINRVIPVA